jgi:dephospho-CoA kinase
MKRVIGITGGVGSGKSRILSILREQYQAEIIQADLVAAELEQPGGIGLERLVEVFGDGILAEDGSLDRKAFADRIFGDAGALKQVNAIIHPLTYEEIRRRIAASTAPVVAVEAALFDAESKNFCPEMWFVDTSVENRILRLMENRGYSRDKCENIMKNQPSREAFLRFADRVIDNNGSFEDACSQIACLMEPERNTDETS